MKKILQKMFDVVTSEILLMLLICYLVFPSFEENNLWLKQILIVLLYFGFFIGVLVNIGVLLYSKRYMSNLNLFVLIFILSVLLLVVLPLFYFDSLDIFPYISLFLIVFFILLGSVVFKISKDISEKKIELRYALKWSISLGLSLMIIGQIFPLFNDSLNAKFKTYYFLNNPYLDSHMTTFYFEGHSIFSYNQKSLKSLTVREANNQISVEVDLQESEQSGDILKIKYVCYGNRCQKD